MYITYRYLSQQHPHDVGWLDKMYKCNPTYDSKGEFSSLSEENYIYTLDSKTIQTSFIVKWDFLKTSDPKGTISPNLDPVK